MHGKTHDSKDNSVTAEGTMVEETRDTVAKTPDLEKTLISAHAQESLKIRHLGSLTTKEPHGKNTQTHRRLLGGVE